MPLYEQFREHYATRNDDDLQAIAKTQGLDEIARQALYDELNARGKASPEQRVSIIEDESAGRSLQRREKLQQAARRRQRILQLSYVLAICLCGYAVLQGTDSTRQHGNPAMLSSPGVVFTLLGRTAGQRRAKIKRTLGQASQP